MGHPFLWTFVHYQVRVRRGQPQGPFVMSEAVNAPANAATSKSTPDCRSVSSAPQIRPISIREDRNAGNQRAPSDGEVMRHGSVASAVALVRGTSMCCSERRQSIR
jgi:hypothetical protein